MRLRFVQQNVTKTTEELVETMAGWRTPDPLNSTQRAALPEVLGPNRSDRLLEQ